MKKFYLLLIGFSLCLTTAYADNTLSLQNLSIEQGTTAAVLPVSLTNESNITGFQCDLYLPSGVMVATDEYGDYMISVARTTASRHTISTSLQVDGALRILCTSMTNATFSGNSGTVLNVTLTVPESMAAGTHDMSLKNIVLSDPDANRHTSSDMTATLVVEGGGIEESVNVLSLQDLSIEQGTTEAVLPISLTNESSITGFQCDLYLPSGVTVATDEYGDYMIAVARTTASRHTISTSLQADGTLRILCTSMTNATFSGNSGTVLNVTLAVPESMTAGTHNMSLKNIVLSDPDANRHTSPDMTATFAVEGVGSEESVNILSLQNLSIVQGTTELVLPVSLANKNSITGFQCDLYLPSGVTVTTDEYGDYMIAVARTTASRHTISTSLQTDGALRILCTSMTNATFSGNSGTVLNVTLTVPESMAAGTHDMSLKNIVLSDPDANRHTSPDMTSSLIVAEVEKITIRANNITMVYGDAVPKLTYTSEGAELVGTPVLSCSATSTSPVGIYPITVAKGSVENKNVSLVNGTLTIVKAPLTISAGSYTKKQGEVNPEFTATYSGFKNGETTSVLTKQPTFTTDVTAFTAPGQYAVKVSGAEAQNYEISYVDGLIIVKNSFCSMEIQAGEYGRCIVNNQVVEPNVTYSSGDVFAYDSILTIYFVPFEGYTTICMKRNGTLVVVRNNMYEEKITEDVVFSDIRFEALADTFYISDYEDLIAPIITSNGAMVAIAPNIPGITIYYTTDGSIPTSVSKKYTGPFEATDGMVVSAIAIIESKMAQKTISVSGIESASSRVKSYRFFNELGIELDTPSQGVNIVLTEYDDGSRKVTKMYRK